MSASSRIKLFVALLGASAANVALAGSSATMPSHIAGWLSSATKVGEADASQTVKMSAFIGFRDDGALRQLIAAQSTPGSAQYGKYLTAAEFKARFAPTDQQVKKVEDALSTLGFAVGSKPSSGLYVEFSGTVAQVKAAFHVNQSLYSFAGKTLRATAAEPTLPASLTGLVTAITGLDDSGLLIHPFHVTLNSETAQAPAGHASAYVTPPPAANLPSPYCSTYFGDNVATLTTQPAPYPAQVPWLLCDYTPQQMRAAYGVDKVVVDGSGVTVAIVDAYASPTLLNDANRYSKNHGLPKLVSGGNFQEIYGGDIGKVSASDPCQPQGWFGEISLDVDAVHSMATGANILYSGALSCSNVDLIAAEYTVVDGTAETAGPLADIITNSWGDTGDINESLATINVYDAVFEQAAAEGVTILYSSGDNGDVALQIGIANASFPASDSLVTAVGGTSLGLTNPSGAKSEWGWGTFRAYLANADVVSASTVDTSGTEAFSFYSGSGGGASYYFEQPSYQVGIVPDKLASATYALTGKKYKLSPPARVVPDVSMDADPYTGFLYGETFAIAGNPISDSGCTPLNTTYEYCEEGIGGTSLASPLFAGTLALVDQLRKANGVGDLGPANTRLYALQVGTPGSTTTPLVDVQAPATPTALLRGYLGSPTRIRLITINSVPGPFGPLCKGSFCEGQDSFTLETTKGYDDVTGLGTPFAPSLLVNLGH